MMIRDSGLPVWTTLYI